MSQLNSPGVSVTLIDESQYVATSGGALNTVPLIVAATRRNKQLSDGSIAPNTTTAAAGKLELVTGREDFRRKFGMPYFKNINGTPVHGDEINEYGMHTAWNLLNTVDRMYILPVDLDLAELDGRPDVPRREPEDGTHWLDISRSRFGLFEWSETTKQWVPQDVYILDDMPGTGDVQPQQNAAADPKNTFGLNGEYAIVTSAIPMIAWQKVGGTWIMLGAEAHPNDFQFAPHTRVPKSRGDGTPLQHGDLYIQTTSSNNGTFFDMSSYEAASGNFVTKEAPMFVMNDDALDYFTQTEEIQGGEVYIRVDHEGKLNPYYHYDPSRPKYSDGVGVMTPMVHNGETNLVATSSQDVPNINLTNYPVSQVIINGVTVTFDSATSADGSSVRVEDMIRHLQGIDDLKRLGLRFNLEGKKLVIVNTTGKDITIKNVGKVNTDWAPNTMTDVAAVLGFRYNVTAGLPNFRKSNWEILPVVASSEAPTREIEIGSLWHNTSLRVELLQSYYDTSDYKMKWRPYAWSRDDGSNGLPSRIHVRSSEPEDLSEGDIWLDSSDLENYPMMYRKDKYGWEKIDNTDQTSEKGIVFANYSHLAPFSEDGSRRDSSEVNEFAPNPDFYPEGILLWNMDYSTYDVKEYRGNDEWISVSGTRPDGAPYMGRKAQRNIVVRAMKQTIAASKEIRAMHRFFNLLGAPGYIEVLPDLTDLNVSRKETGFVVSGAPLRLPVDGSAVQEWANNERNAFQTGEDGLNTFNRMSSVYAFAGLQNDTNGSMIAVPADTIALDTIARSDKQSYPWFAPAGYTRGQVFSTNALGYVQDGQFKAAEFDEGVIDTLYINKINPIVTFPGEGKYVWGQKTLSPIDSAMDRINVARLTAYLRYELDRMVRPYIFEPNDTQTRSSVESLIDGFLADIVDRRGLYDYIVVCNESNNTPTTIDRNELHIDIAISPIKSVEFVYIPIRLVNTGEL